MQTEHLMLSDKATTQKEVISLGQGRILIVEDEPKVAEALREGLVSEGYEITLAMTGEEAFFQASSERFDLLLLDLMLPGRSGIEVLETLRKKGEKTPVLILTARDTIEDRIKGLDTGADDYLVKPFAFPELLARVRALLRRGRPVNSETIRRLADLEIDLVVRTVLREGKPIELTLKEFDLLEYLLRNQGQLVSREMLARDVWKEASRATSLDNVIDVHMARLRKKVDQDFSKKLIHTVRGVGFMAKDGGR
jgi:two-component system, OmpR family, copper resistance phosphate regulon response regulator CusR